MSEQEVSDLESPVEGSGGRPRSLLCSEKARPAILSVDTEDVFPGHEVNKLLPCCLHAEHSCQNHTSQRPFAALRMFRRSSLLQRSLRAAAQYTQK